MVGSTSEKPPAWLERYVVEPIAWIFGYVEDPSKVMFGSDWPLVDMASYVAAYKQAIPREHWSEWECPGSAAYVFATDSAAATCSGGQSAAP